MAKKSFAVLGLGIFGQSVAKALIERKAEVTVFDTSEKEINDFQTLFPVVNAVIADITSPNFVEKHGLDNFDAVILVLASNLEANLLASVMLNNHEGIGNLIVRAKDKLHYQILKKIGIQNVIWPDEKIGKIIASQALFGIDSSIQLINDNYAIVEIVVKNPEKVNKSLRDLNLLNKKDYNIVHVTRNNTVKLPAEIDKLQLNDCLLVVTRIKKVNFLEEQFN